MGQLEILEQVKPEHLSQRLGRRLLDDLALKMPRDVGEKLTVDAKGFAPRLATALQKLNVKHPVLRARRRGSSWACSGKRLKGIQRHIALYILHMPTIPIEGV